MSNASLAMVSRTCGRSGSAGCSSGVHGGRKWSRALGGTTDTGDLVTLKLSPEGYRETSRAHLIDPTQAAGGRKVTRAHPAFAGRKVYARNDKQVVCVFLAKE